MADMQSVLRIIPLPAVLLALLSLLGCGEKENVRVYESVDPASYNWPKTEPREDSYVDAYQTSQGTQERTWVWDVPAGWVDAPELSSFHIADYRFPGTRQSLPGRVTISVSQGEGGGIRENIQRWRGQLYIAPPKGPAPGDTSKTFGTVTIVNLSGQYQGENVPTHLLGAIVQLIAVDGSVYQTWFFKMLGDEETIRRNGAPFLKMVISLRLQGEPAPDVSGQVLEQLIPGDDSGASDSEVESTPRPSPLKPETEQRDTP